MSSPAGHLIAGLGAYLGATAPGGASKLRSGWVLALVCLMALIPDLAEILVRAGGKAAVGGAGRWDVVALMHGVGFGIVASAALAGMIPGLRSSFWAGALVLLAGLASHAVLDWATLGGVTWLAPFDWRPASCGVAILPTAGARVLSYPFLAAMRIMGIEAGILLPLVWTAWILGRREGLTRSRAWLAAYAMTWPLAGALVFWTIRRGGSV